MIRRTKIPPLLLHSILSLAAVAMVDRVQGSSERHKATITNPDSPQTDLLELVPGKPLERQLTGGEAHIYRIEREVASDEETPHALLPSQTSDPVATYTQASKLYGSNQPEAALSLLKKIVQQHPSFNRAYAKLVTVFKEQKNMGSARTYFKSLLEREPQNPYAAYGLGLTFKEESQYPQAIEQFKACIRLDPEFAAAYTDLGATADAGRTLPDAAAFIEQMQANHPGTAATLYGLGYVALLQNQRERALTWLDQATNRDPRSWEAHWATAVVYRRVGRLQEALDLYQRLLGWAEQVSDDERRAQAHGGVGQIANALDSYSLALEHFEHALHLAHELGNRRYEEGLLSNIGVIYGKRDQYVQASIYFRRALALAQALGARNDEGRIWGLLATVHQQLGDFTQAGEFYQTAVAIARETGDLGGEGANQASLGEIYARLGDCAQALPAFQRALEIVRNIGPKASEADHLVQVGHCRLRLGHHFDALTTYQQALEIAQATGARRVEADCWNGLGEVHRSLKDDARAVNEHQKALRLGAEIESPQVLWRANAGLAAAYELQGRLAEALSHYRQAVELIETVRGKLEMAEEKAGFLQDKIEVYKNLIGVLVSLQEKEPTKGHDSAALEISERARARSLLEILTEARADLRQGVDSVLLERERRLQQHLNAKERYRMQLLSGKHTDEQAAAAKKEVESLLAQYQEVQAEIRVTSPRYAALTQPQTLSLKEIQQQVLDEDTLLLEYALGEERSFLWAVTTTSIKSYELPKRAEIEAATRRAYELMRTSNKAAAKAQAELVAANLSRMILGPVANRLGKKRLLMVSDGALQYIPFGALPAPAAAGAETETEGGGDAGRSRPGDTGTRRRGDEERIATSNTRSPAGFKAPRVSVSPRPRVGFVPLIERHEIVSLPSASVLALLRRELAGRQPAPKTVAVLADPVFDPHDERLKLTQASRRPMAGGEKQTATGVRASAIASSEIPSPTVDIERSARESGLTTFERLRFTRREADLITGLTSKEKSLKALDFQASRATATSSHLSEYRIVHFATHGLLNSLHPELSGLVLSLVDDRGRPQDGFLRLFEIYNLKLAADLVVLSACQTALGKEIKGEGLLGLTRGFMYAGVPRVVVSLWNVSDEATAVLMSRLYRGMLIDGLRPAEALRAAQVSMRKEERWKAPYYWAGFVLQGEWK